MELTSVVLRGDIVRQVVVHDEANQTVEERQVNLLVHLRQDGFHHDVALSFTGLPNVGQVVDALAPLVDQERRRLGILQERKPLSGSYRHSIAYRRFDPGREEPTLVGLEEQELVEILTKNMRKV